MVETKKTILDMCLAKQERSAAIMARYERPPSYGDLRRAQISETEKQGEMLFQVLLIQSLGG
jgi:hypothetical protein